MPDYYEIQIREAAVTSLSGQTGAGLNVFASKIGIFQEHQLPSINVFVASERDGSGSMGAIGVSVSLSLQIRAKGKDSDPVPPVNVVDAIKADAIAVLEASGLLGLDVEWDNNEPVEGDDEANEDVLVVETTFSISLRVAKGDHTTII